MSTTSPLRYPGGKFKTYKLVEHLIEINKCDSYAEPFAGGAGVAIKLLMENKVKKVYLNDFDKGIYALWYSILYFTEELIELIKKTEITINEWNKQRIIHNNKDNNSNLLEIGFSTLFLNRTNRSGIIKGGVIGGKKQLGEYKLDCRFNKETIIKRINIISKFKNKILLTNKDAIDFINQNLLKTKNTFIFLDPPYYNKGPGLYTNFYVHENHKQLSQIIKNKLESYYWILTYDVTPSIYDMYKSNRFDIYYLNYSIAKPSKGKEYIFFSDKLKIDCYEEYLNLLEDKNLVV